MEEIQLTPLNPDRSPEEASIHRGIVRAGAEEAEFYYLRPPGVAPAPTVALLPILAGGDALMWLAAEGLAARGMGVLWTRRVASALKPGQRGEDLETLFRRTVVHNRMVLAWAREQPEIDRDRLGLVGLSTGGVVGGVLMALEPGLAGGVLCLSGGDLPRLLAASAEKRIVHWRRWRATEDGLAGDSLSAELRRTLQSDPALLGPYVRTDRVLLVDARFDDVVPAAQRSVLWEALGRPERVELPLTHYTAALALGTVLDMGCGFLTRRFANQTTR